MLRLCFLVCVLVALFQAPTARAFTGPQEESPSISTIIIEGVPACHLSIALSNIFSDWKPPYYTFIFPYSTSVFLAIESATGKPECITFYFWLPSMNGSYPLQEGDDIPVSYWQLPFGGSTFTVEIGIAKF